MNIRPSIKFLLTVGCAAGISCAAPPAEASVVIGGTRVIYLASESMATLKVSNEAGKPALIQSWIDAGDINQPPSDADVPFIITPPLAYIAPDRSQTLRIVYTGEALPKEQESVFWLNVLEVPIKHEASANQLQLAVRSRLKLFYRPEKLKGSADAAPAALTWRLMQRDGRPAVQAYNPTPFHVSLTEVSVHADGKIAHFGEGGMLGPGATLDFSLKDGVVEVGAANASVRYRALNDAGGPIDGEARLDGKEGNHAD